MILTKGWDVPVPWEDVGDGQSVGMVMVQM